MTDAELDRLAGLIADALLRDRPHPDAPSHATPARASWLPAPVRPEPPSRGGDPPAWSGAAQSLADVAPGRGDSPARAPIGEATAAIRAAAAGHAAPPAGHVPGRVAMGTRGRAPGAGPIPVRIGVSSRHLHLSPAHVEALFGAELSVKTPIAQPGQFAANETVRVSGPMGTVDAIRVVGPARGETQLELARTDAHTLGIAAPVAASGSLAASAGGVTLTGPAGTVRLERGVIVAARHLHLSPADAKRWRLADGDRLDVACGEGTRAVVFRDVLVRSGPTHATELHLDTDEANAAGVQSGDEASIVAWRAGMPARRPVVTERDVQVLARAGQPLPPDALLTPSARDRARALGLLDA